MNVFYSSEINPQASFFVLNKDESHHCKVLRIRKAEQIGIIDGKGNFYIGIVTDNNPNACAGEIIEIKKQFNKRNYHLHIAMAPVKNSDRLEFFLEKAIEIGIDSITFLKTRFTERKKLNLQRIEKIIISAMKQSKNAFRPKTDDITDFDIFINKNIEGQKFIALCNAEKKLPELIKPNGKYTFLIGPEGGFDEKEINSAIKNNFLPVKLANNRLRTETAAIYSVFSVFWTNL